MTDTPTLNMRKGCRVCGHDLGYIEHRNGQDVMLCAKCGSYQYCAPKSETGRATTSTRSRADIKPKVKARVLARHGHQCVSCGRSPAVHGVVLDIDHLVPVALAKKHDLHDEIIDSEWNLVPTCAECNRGKQDDLNAVSVQLIYRVLRMKAATS